MRRSPAEKAARKEQQDRVGAVNMASYLREQQATLDRTARLRAQRVALPEMKNPAASNKKRALRRTLPGLHQGVRR
jgi:hypothetical protein